jgi:hypothetical protein
MKGKLMNDFEMTDLIVEEWLFALDAIVPTDSPDTDPWLVAA